MKNKILATILPFMIAPAALASEINCHVVRTNMYDSRDCMSQDFYQRFYDNSDTGLITSGQLRGGLIPVNASVRYAFSYVGQSYDTKLELNTWGSDTGLHVATDISYGSVGITPSPVENRFQAGDYEYDINCSVLD